MRPVGTHHQNSVEENETDHWARSPLKEADMRVIPQNRYSPWRIFLVLLALTVLLVPGARAQMGKGRINGTIADENGRPLEKALIVARHLESEKALESLSDKKGRFAMGGMRSGRWRITITKEGYEGSFLDVEISQLKANPPFALILKPAAAAGSGESEDAEALETGNRLMEQEKYDEALAVFNEFLARRPDVYHVRLNIGTCYLEQGDLAKAEAEYRLVLDKARENGGNDKKSLSTISKALTGLGETSMKKDDFEAAGNYFSQALDISPNDEVAAYNVAEIFFSHQKVDEAIRYLELSIRINPAWSKPYMKLGYAYLNKGDFDKSLGCFETFMKMDPENPAVPAVSKTIAAIEGMKRSPAVS